MTQPKAKMPAVQRPANWKTLPGPENITRAALPNGITVLVRSNFNSPSISIGGYLACGSMFDPPDKLGLAQFTAASLMRGSEQRSFHEIYDQLESVGAGLGFGASVHNVNFGARALAEDLPLLLTLLADALCCPTFPADHVEQLRSQILTSLAIRDQDTGDQVDMAVDEIIFPGHPYGRPEDGYTETILSITRDDLIQFYRQHYGPHSLVIVVTGAVDAGEAVEQVQNALGGWRQPSQPAAAAQPLAAIRPLTQTFRRHIALPGKYQTDLAIGTLGPKRSSPDYVAVSLGNNILGQFGMMGRIGDVVREKAGLAYYASTGLSASLEAGSWEVTAGVNPVNLQKAIDLILSELRHFIQEPVSEDELRDSQANYIGRLPLSLESNAGVVNALLNIERFQLGLDYYQRFPDMIQSITTDQVLEMSRRYWDLDRLAVVSSGPELQEPVETQ